MWQFTKPHKTWRFQRHASSWIVWITKGNEPIACWHAPNWHVPWPVNWVIFFNSLLEYMTNPIFPKTMGKRIEIDTCISCVWILWCFDLEELKGVKFHSRAHLLKIRVNQNKCHCFCDIFLNFTPIKVGSIIKLTV